MGAGPWQSRSPKAPTPGRLNGFTPRHGYWPRWTTPQWSGSSTRASCRRATRGPGARSWSRNSSMAGALPSASAEARPAPRRSPAGLRRRCPDWRTSTRAGFVHRDIKPANILLSALRRSAVRIADFGIATRGQLRCRAKRFVGDRPLHEPGAGSGPAAGYSLRHLCAGPRAAGVPHRYKGLSRHPRGVPRGPDASGSGDPLRTGLPLGFAADGDDRHGPRGTAIRRRGRGGGGPPPPPRFPADALAYSGVAGPNPDSRPGYRRNGARSAASRLRTRRLKPAG